MLSPAAPGGYKEDDYDAATAADAHAHGTTHWTTLEANGLLQHTRGGQINTT